MVTTSRRHSWNGSERIEIGHSKFERQPESTTEDLEDAGDQDDGRGDAEDEDMKALGAVCEEPVTTIGVDFEKLEGSENVEESFIHGVNGGFLDPEMVRRSTCGRISWIPGDAGISSRLQFLSVGLIR